MLEQPEGASDQEHLNRIMPLIELDREWDELRRRTHIYLVVAYGFSLMSCFSILGQIDASQNEALTKTLYTVTMFFALGLVVSSFAYVVYLLSAWITMRNRKSIVSGSRYFIGYWESRYSQFSGILGGASALWFSYTVGYGLFEIWRSSV